MPSRHLGRAALVVVVTLPFVATFVGASTSCTDETVSFGLANGLRGRTPNDVVGEGGTTSSSGGPEAGGACTPPPDAGDAGANCPTFTTMFKNYFAPTGEWKCGQAGCHNAANLGGQQPAGMDDQNSTYDVLKNTAKVAAAPNLPYIRPNCVGTNESAILCNIAKTPQPCGTPMPSGIPLSDASVQELAKWVACGAPGPL
jgi:hypothetical protein